MCPSLGHHRILVQYNWRDIRDGLWEKNNSYIIVKTSFIPVRVVDHITITLGSIFNEDTFNTSAVVPAVAVEVDPIRWVPEDRERREIG